MALDLTKTKELKPSTTDLGREERTLEGAEGGGCENDCPCRP